MPLLTKRETLSLFLFERREKIFVVKLEFENMLTDVSAKDESKSESKRLLT